MSGPSPARRDAGERRLAWLLTIPALVPIALIVLFPLGWTAWESLHRHDLDMPWLGTPFIGLGNYARIAHDARFWAAVAHTLAFAVVTVAAELVLGLAAALAMQRAVRGRSLTRAGILLPWAIPTVVTGLLWRFLFDAPGGAVDRILATLGLVHRPIVWLVGAHSAWLPILLGDAWKTTPFVALLLLAGLQGIDPALEEAAAVDGAGWWWRLWHITIPLLRPAILVALLFRLLDAFRVFDLIYVLTGGGPGTSTEPVSLYAFTTLLQDLRFGYGSALAVVIFLITLALAAACIALVGRGTWGGGERA